MIRMASGTKVRIGSGHWGYVQDHAGDAVLIAFFYPNNSDQAIKEYWIAAWDVAPVKVPDEAPV